MAKKSFINNVHLEGLLYEHDLVEKVTGPNSAHPGTLFISGTISIATDGNCINVVPVHYTYVTPTTSTGKTNPAYTTLKDIIEGKIGTVMKNGKENAGLVRVDTSIGLNEFYSEKNGTEELISAKRNEGGFIHRADNLASIENQRNTFECDMLVTKTTRVEANEEKNIPERVIVKGAIFDFRKALLPVEFTVYDPDGQNYFEALGASATQPVFTKVFGTQVSETQVKKIEQASAFGAPIVKEITSTRKDFVLVGANEEPYLWDDESTITAAEVKEMLATRETTLATIKQRQDDYKASKNTAKAAPTAASAPAVGGFNF